MKTTKGGKVMNPTDAYRKELRKKELKRNKKERKKVREVGILKKDPEQLKEQIEKLNAMKADGALDKARKHKKRQLEDTLTLVMKKRKEYEEKMREKGEAPVMFSHLGPPRRLTTAEEEERVKHPKPEDSVYYHPTLNPTGAPPPGKPPMFKSSIGPRIPLSADSSSADASSSKTDPDDVAVSVPPPPPSPPPPPPPSFRNAGESNPADHSILTASLPLPPPPPLPPNPATSSTVSLPLPPLPPPPPGPPPKELSTGLLTLTPPPLSQSIQPPPPGTGGNERERGQIAVSEEPTSKEHTQVPPIFPPPPPAMPPNSVPPIFPPPPPAMPPNSANNHTESAASNADGGNLSVSKEIPKFPLPPPMQQPLVPGPSSILTLQPDVLPPGISHFPPPPPPLDMRQPLSSPGLQSRPSPPGMMVPLLPRPPYGPPPMMRPPLPPGPPPTLQEDDRTMYRPTVPQKPSHVKSAASTVVKRPLAQHIPELTSMVPASVRVRRENAASKPKCKQSVSNTATAYRHVAPAVKLEAANNTSSTQKTQSIDDSYTAFLEDMKALGALDE